MASTTSKVVRILLTAALNLADKSPEVRSDARQATLVVAFLLEDDITDTISDALAEAVASKTHGLLEEAAGKLDASSAFLTATDVKQVETTLTLKSVSSQLENVATSLDALATKLTGSPQRS
ncbi:hypothetical protein LshimejAT787_1204030 [Lyophyllum shimeji]|uniref:Uncharacterized protein n=1 Tax=Lyophyllum shimeji TaxID=47721 RepID=A0A9P3UPM9_LYOSH|nr:hypothetical protein LshimejAT787_1204030 [Lyophyllum shimeji]